MKKEHNKLMKNIGKAGLFLAGAVLLSACGEGANASDDQTVTLWAWGIR